MRKLLDYARISVSSAEFAWKLLTIAIVLGGGTTAGFLAASSQLARALGPLVWFGIALISGFIISLIFYFARAAQLAGAQAMLATSMVSKPSEVNPLWSSFTDLVIPMASLHLPGQQLHQHKQFRRCKFVGPGAVALMGGTFVRINFHDTGHILTIPDNTIISGTTIFQNCTVEDCDFYQVTLMIPRSNAAGFAAIPGAQVAM
ncbi:hypothetical protein SAMN05414139_05642 [Burkholderia sp. D7]|nr:hypothetical protein SAMN05414139_05642 [Burkholderia sp. D7]